MQALRARMQHRRQSIRGRKALLTLQYVVTIALLIVSFFFIKQLYFMLNKDMGFKQNNIVQMQFFEDIPFNRHAVPEEDKEKAWAAYRELATQQENNMQYAIDQIHQYPYVQHLTINDDPLDISLGPMRKKGAGTEYYTVHRLTTTPNFAKLYEIEVIEGRFFDRNLDEDRDQKVVINEKARQFFQIDQVPGSFLSDRYWGADKNPFEVIGVVKDYHSEHLSNPVSPQVIFFHDDPYTFSMELVEGHEAEALTFLKELYEEVNPGKDFSYRFIDEEVQKIYEEDRSTIRVYSLFAILTLVISSIGLFGISLYDVQQRIKEIGIRKVSGASTQQIIGLLTKDFFRLILLGFVLACPLAAVGIYRYLEGFAYRTPLSWWVFVLAGGVVVLVAFGTLIWQSYRAAIRNPILALRYE